MGHDAAPETAKLQRQTHAAIADLLRPAADASLAHATVLILMGTALVLVLRHPAGLVAQPA
jgi:hypothetical protein